MDMDGFEAALTDVEPLREAQLVARRVAESANVSSFYLSHPDGKPLPLFAAGQYILVRAPDGRTAPFFLSAYARVPRSYRFTLLKQPVETEDISGFLTDAFVSGSLLTISGPFGTFRLPENGTRPIVIASRGIGGVVAAALGDELLQRKSRPPIRFVHVEQHESDPVLYGTKFRLLCAEMKDARFSLLGQNGAKHDTIEFIADALQAQADADQFVDKPLYVLCGAEAFVQPLSRSLQNRAVPPASIATLNFGPLKREFDTLIKTPMRPIEFSPCAVTFSRSGKKATWTQDGGTLLDFATAQAIPLPFSCKTGMCGTCAQRLVSGEVSAIKKIAAQNITPGRILLCSHVPVGDITLEI